MQTALDELRAALTAERVTVQRRADEALAAMRQKCTDAQEDLKLARLDVDALAHDLRKSAEELARERINMAAAQEEFDAKLEAMQRDFERKKQEQQHRTEQQLNEAATQHKLFVDDLMWQHQEERKAQEAVVRELQAALEELRYRYEYRESRPEDVAMINRLMKEGRQKDQTLKKAINDMKMYKLELINREENYNKVFGRRPLVASNDTADSVQQQQQQQQQDAHRRSIVNRRGFST
ncbi:hypothetical protein DQ04_03071100 [Trypanosoma grayi]|uniref:hypothetical protein n=1 Tax=Trypanosoma grayi TaxID=71804 RepID=UPI0004F413C9|nr:hypothetical protein DQ04_03071100 [Trypanosoma grayi]KEG11004.1 hypothetical protein DQ04_03071100 [Trypanosoma grayi]